MGELTEKGYARFVEAYRRLADDGKADAPFGAEYERVLAKWVEASYPDNVEAFIYKHANELLI